MGNKSLELMQQVIIKYFTFVFFVICRCAIVNTKNIVSEGWGHEELLHHAVHVTDATEVSKTDVFLHSRALPRWLIVPLVWLINHLKERHKLLLHETSH